MLLTLEERREAGGGGGGENVIKTISTRLAGGRRELNTEPSKVRDLLLSLCITHCLL
jgi:DNA excision repair protein ERCC-4